MICLYKNVIIRIACTNNSICYTDALVRLVFGLKSAKWLTRSLLVEFHNHPMHSLIANCTVPAGEKDILPFLCSEPIT